MKIQVKNADSNPKKRLIVSKDTSQTISCLIALLILIVLFSVMSPYFLSSDNLANVLTQIITTALLGFGMTYVIISGEIDLSIAPTLAMSSVIVATLLSKGYPMIICCLGVLVSFLVWSMDYLLPSCHCLPLLQQLEHKWPFVV